jgi:hypothetical protein
MAYQEQDPLFFTRTWSGKSLLLQTSRHTRSSGADSAVVPRALQQEQA